LPPDIDRPEKTGIQNQAAVKPHILNTPILRSLKRVDLTNSGSVTGAEVVQLYVTYPGSAVERSVLELKDFAKVTLDQGETQTVEISLAVDDLAY